MRLMLWRKVGHATNSLDECSIKQPERSDDRADEHAGSFGRTNGSYRWHVVATSDALEPFGVKNRRKEILNACEHLFYDYDTLLSQQRY